MTRRNGCRPERRTWILTLRADRPNQEAKKERGLFGIRHQGPYGGHQFWAFEYRVAPFEAVESLVEAVQGEWQRATWKPLSRV